MFLVSFKEPHEIVVCLVDFRLFVVTHVAEPREGRLWPLRVRSNEFLQVIEHLHVFLDAKLGPIIGVEAVV